MGTKLYNKLPGYIKEGIEIISSSAFLLLSGRTRSSVAI